MNWAVKFLTGDIRIRIIIRSGEAPLFLVLRPTVIFPMSVYKEEMAT